MNSTGWIDSEGKYHKSAPDVGAMKSDHSLIEKTYSIDRQREAHRRDLIQPYKNGQPNPEFVQQYPDLAKERGMI